MGRVTNRDRPWRFIRFPHKKPTLSEIPVTERDRPWQENFHQNCIEIESCLWEFVSSDHFGSLEHHGHTKFVPCIVLGGCHVGLGGWPLGQGGAWWTTKVVGMSMFQHIRYIYICVLKWLAATLPKGGPACAGSRWSASQACIETLWGWWQTPTPAWNIIYKGNSWWQEILQ